MAVAGSPAQVEYKKVKTSDLHFDPSNPRFGRGGGSSDPAIQALLEKEPHLALDLVDSFLTNGFIQYEPLVVRHRTEGGYLVVEGNRRLAALRHILGNKDKYAKNPRINELESIPVLIFPEGGSEQDKEQRVYLGVRHLFGFRDWPAESKARFLDSQIKTKADLERVMSELNIKRHELSRYLIPLRLRKKAKDLWEPHKDQDFWTLGEGLARTGIKEYIGLEVDKNTLEIKKVENARLKNLLGFVYGTPQKERQDARIEETRDLSKLSTVLVHAQARAALEKGKTLEEALILVDSPNESLKRLKKLSTEFKALVSRMKSKPGGAVLAAKFTPFEQAIKKFIRDAQ